MEYVGFVGIKKAAELSGLSVHFWRKAVTEGRVPFIKSGVKFYIDFDSAMEKLRTEVENS